MAPLFAKQRLFRTADGRIVAEGDPDAAFLFASAEGEEIDPNEAEEYGLTGDSDMVSTTPPGSEPAPEEKQAEQPADKAAAAPANKGRSRSS